ncbi:tetratricopeptide repeat protein [Desulfovibrio sp. Huiquan2017]|uniref:tetratricopeptide repeat protein n=1 Tax=Desulfovibrio sp. Huiquan2017 TaxID=2816861 RepID=UPI001A92A97E|nr:tetratricopeptide repeat protein [Desulfovibrio sp. Huiquan2017]
MSTLKQLGILNRDGMRACNEGRPGDALFQLTQADSLARSLNSPLHEAKVRNNMALVYQMSGKYAEARVSFRIAANRAVEGGGEDTGLYRAIMRNLDSLTVQAKEKAA